MLVTNIFSFSHNVFYSPQNKFQFLSNNFLSSANPFNLDWYQILLFGKDLKVALTRPVTKRELTPPPNTPPPPRTLTETSILYTDTWTDTWTDRQADSSIPSKTILLRGYNDRICLQ